MINDPNKKKNIQNRINEIASESQESGLTSSSYRHILQSTVESNVDRLGQKTEKHLELEDRFGYADRRLESAERQEESATKVINDARDHRVQFDLYQQQAKMNMKQMQSNPNVSSEKYESYRQEVQSKMATMHIQSKMSNQASAIMQASMPEYIEERETAGLAVAEIGTKIQDAQAIANSVAFNNTQRSVGAATSDKALASRRSFYKSQAGFYDQARGLSDKYTHEELQDIASGVDTNIQESTARIRSISTDRSLGDEERLNKIGKEGSKMESTIATQALAQKAIQISKGNTDIESLDKSTRSTMDRIEDERFTEALRSDANSGKLNVKDSATAKSAAQDQLVDATATLTKAMKSGEKVSMDMIKTYKDASKKYQQASETYGAALKGGGGMSGTDKFRAMLGMAGSVVSGAAEVNQAVGVNQTIQEVQNKTGLMQMKNQQFEDFRRSQAGDAASFRRHQEGIWEKSLRGGSRIGEIAETTVQARLGLGAAGVIDSGTQTAAAVANMANITGLKTADAVERLEAGTKGLVGGLASTAIAKGDLERDISKEGATVAHAGSTVQMSNAQKYIANQEIDNFTGVLRSVGASTRNFGSRRDGIVTQQTSSDYMESMQSLGIDGQRLGSLNQSAASNLGRQFDAGADYRKLRGFEIGGFGGMEQNLGRAGALVEAGADSGMGSLTNILEQAVSKGMDSSKAVDALVTGIAGMSRSSSAAAMGIDTTPILTKAVTQIARGDIKNDIQRAKTAVDTVNNINANIEDSSVSFGKMYRIQTVANEMGISAVDATAMTNWDATTQRVFGSGTADQAAKMLIEKGKGKQFGIRYNDSGDIEYDDLTKFNKGRGAFNQSMGTQAFMANGRYAATAGQIAPTAEEMMIAGRAAREGGAALNNPIYQKVASTLDLSGYKDARSGVHAAAAAAFPDKFTSPADEKLKKQLNSTGDSKTESGNIESIVSAAATTFMMLAQSGKIELSKITGAKGGNDAAAYADALKEQQKTDNSGKLKADNEETAGGLKGVDKTLIAGTIGAFNTTIKKFDAVCDGILSRMGVGEQKTGKIDWKDPKAKVVGGFGGG